MQENKIKNQERDPILHKDSKIGTLRSIPIDKLIAHPGNPNRMSKRNFSRLVRNIGRTSRYEPLVVRKQGDYFQIINGHHRCQALRQLGHQTADAVVWDVDDAETDILLSTLNQLKGSDILEKKLDMLERINRVMHDREMAKLIPFTRSQIKKLKNIRIPTVPVKINVKSLAEPMVFFLNDIQQKIVKQALSLTQEALTGRTKAVRNAAALTEMARMYLVQHEQSQESNIQKQESNEK